METKKFCLRCGRRLYVNDYCKPCTREIRIEKIEQHYKEHPNDKFSVEFWKNIERIQLEDRRKRTQQKRSLKYNYGIGDKLRGDVRNLLKSTSLKVKNTYNELIGCSPNELKTHLEENFTQGMTWENYGSGGWHIDHILPCAVFDLKDPKEQKKCFHYSNLQPMWATENFDKNAGYQTTFNTLELLNQYINTHNMPASAKTIVKTDKSGNTFYRLKFKFH